ncbi:MAG: preprotein translocase subunit YajC [Chthoniobacterales bacterium]|nr:preprotein translocase subunit YajC [Chthoniobacterales bacterium]
MNISDFLILAQAATPAQPQQNLLVSMMPLVFIFVIFYFLLIRPQQKRQKDHEKLVQGVKTGDQVVTSSGIHGTISNVKDKTVIVKIADNVKVEFDRAAIASVQKPDAAA